jgi:hypothetical protein
MIQGCLLRVQKCMVGRSQDVSSSVPARTRRKPLSELDAPQTQEPHSGQTHRVTTPPLSAVRWMLAAQSPLCGKSRQFTTRTSRRSVRSGFRSNFPQQPRILERENRYLAARRRHQPVLGATMGLPADRSKGPPVINFLSEGRRFPIKSTLLDAIGKPIGCRRRAVRGHELPARLGSRFRYFSTSSANSLGLP